MSDVDGKYAGYIHKKAYPCEKIDDDWVVFRPKDNAFAAILPSYIEQCIKLGCSEAQIQSAARMVGRVDIWREEHPELCKNPD